MIMHFYTSRGEKYEELELNEEKGFSIQRDIFVDTPRYKVWIMKGIACLGRYTLLEETILSMTCQNIFLVVIVLHKRSTKQLFCLLSFPHQRTP